MMKINQRMKGLGYALLGLGLYFLVEAFWSLENNGDIGQAKQRLIISLSLNIAGLIFLCVFDRAW